MVPQGARKEAKPCFIGYALINNRNGLCIDISVSKANGRVGRPEALRLLDRQRQTRRDSNSVVGDKGLDTFGGSWGS